MRRPLVIIFLTVFLDLLGMGILMPVVPFVLREYREDALIVGLMALSFSGAQFLASPILGALSDRFGRRPVLLVSLLGTAIGYFMFGWASSLWLLFGSRILDGVTGGNISAAQAYIADISPPEDRAKNFGLIGAAFGLGFIIGPAAGGLLSKISLSAPAFAAGWLSLATVAAAWFALPESLPKSRRTQAPFRLRDVNPLTRIYAAVRIKPLTLLFAAGFFLNFAMAALQSNFAVFASRRFDWGPGEVAAVFVAIGGIGVLTQGVLLRRISGRVDGFRLAGMSVILAAAGFAGIAIAREPWVLYPACMAIAMGFGMTNPTIMGLLSSRVSSNDQGSILGVAQSLASLTRTIGPIFAGVLFDELGAPSPYWAGALFLMAGWLTLSKASSAASTQPSHAASSSQ